MNAITCIENVSFTHLVEKDLRYCLVNERKLPFKLDGSLAKPNVNSDFVDLETLLECKTLTDYAGIGISIQASNICGIDIDDCFSIAFDIDSADNRAITCLSLFKNLAYCEFSFSGRGLRILFEANTIENYSDTYYIKNSTQKIEYYQPSNSYRYVTITGKSIYDNKLTASNLITEALYKFLNIYLLKPKKLVTKIKSDIPETKSLDELLIDVKKLYFTYPIFQNLWFGKAPGSGKNESELDYQLLALLYERITTDKLKLKELFEMSPYYKSKDFKHVNKWLYSNYRYFEYMYSRLK